MNSIIDEKFSIENEIKYGEHFINFKYELSDFQKKSIKAIVDGNHSLVCCGTGNGKTTSGEFAIKHFTGQGKRVIYTVPIRSLGNQKFYDFSQKFPDITFGLLTGEIKAFPNAQVLIMTQEILMNYLFLSKENELDTNKQLTFQIDIENELSAVIVDECHFIMDENRGHAWESTFLMLPKHVQLIMLSATLDNPLKLASWVEQRHNNDDKKVIISSTSKRIIPLIHYAYLTTTEGIFKKVKDKAIHKEINDVTNKLLLLKSEDGNFNESSLDVVRKIKKIYDNNQTYIKRSHVLNNLSRHLVENEMLPAIFYCFSRKNVERCAQEITTNLLEFDSKTPYTIRREANQILRKLPNFTEYTQLPEYQILMVLLEKGIGFHHSGMISVLREIVELFISKGYIKILFCTDSFSVGLNCPIKTTVFTGIKKFDGRNEEFLEPHLYAQCSGRAGRRGIDVIGNVIHCCNIFDIPSNTTYKEILCGKPQKLQSKFRISFNIILNLIKNGHGRKRDFRDFIEKSMIQSELDKKYDILKDELEILQNEMKIKEISMKMMKTPQNVLIDYLDRKEKNANLQNKKRKENERKIAYIIDEHKNCVTDSQQYSNFACYDNKIKCKKIEMNIVDDYIERQVGNICKILEDEKYIQFETESSSYTFTQRGKIASNFSEINPLVFTEHLERIEQLSVKQLIGFLSCFTDIRVHADYRLSSPSLIDDKVIGLLLCDMSNTYNKYDAYQSYYGCCGFDDNTIIYDIITETQSWCDAKDESSCKIIINRLLIEKDVSLGDFSKAIVKISTITKELMNMCENEDKIDFLYKLSLIDELILKHVCTSQSLYI
jgi:superfamily II RNA helicase